jgi:uncharacterized Zn finger protein (UPF0148 family)
MSDFDKEAEREKLREKYATEETDRQATRQMSELLLQGATMTNKHCDDHGDPVFRYQGEEFCPTCRAEAQANADAEGQTVPTGTGPEARTETKTENADTGTAVTESVDIGASVDTETRTETNPETKRPDTGVTDDTGTTVPTDTTSEKKGDASANTATDEFRANAKGPTDEASVGVDTAETSGSVVDQPSTEGRSTSATNKKDLDAAADALGRTLVRFAKAAENAENPRVARDHLAAAREAAETLSALGR